MPPMLKILLTLSVFCGASLAHAGICTREYAPVCGQLPQQTQTFSNRCMMKDAGASWLSEGECPASHARAKIRNIKLAVAGHDVVDAVRLP